MLIMIPVLILFTTSISLVLLRLLRPNFRFDWLLAISGAFFSLVSVILWQLKLPQTFSLPAWSPGDIFLSTPTWLADGSSWLYALSLTTLGLAVISTAVVRKTSNPINWAGILILVSIGLLAVTADNPLTLAIAWVALDVAELLILLRSIKAAESEQIVIAFSVRLGGVFLLLWSSILSVSSGTPMDFRAVPTQVSTLLLLAVGFRLGILPLHLPVKDRDLRRGVITTLRLVSAASGLALLARIPINSVPTTFLPYLLVITGFFSIYGGWRWLTASDELNGRPFWTLSLGSLALAANLFGNSDGNVAWGSSLILSGGLIFLYSARGKRNYWILALGIWGITALPFSLTASTWSNLPAGSGLLMLPHLLGHSLILAGYVRHAFKRQGEIEIESEPRWVQVIYPVGLSTLPIISTLAGLWGWYGARDVGRWWVSAAIIALSIILYLLFNVLTVRLSLLRPRNLLPKTNPISKLLWAVYYSIRQVINFLTSILEGDGGMLWSILLLVLFISLIAQTTH
jgi:hypothetical protein